MNVAKAALPIELDIEIQQGSTWSLAFGPYYRDIDTEQNVLYDTAGYGGHMQIRESYGGPLLIQGLTTGNGRVTTGIQGTAPNLYSVLLSLPHTETELLPGGVVGVYDLELIDTSGRRYTFSRGRCKINYGVTKGSGAI